MIRDDDSKLGLFQQPAKFKIDLVRLPDSEEEKQEKADELKKQRDEEKKSGRRRRGSGQGKRGCECTAGTEELAKCL